VTNDGSAATAVFHTFVQFSPDRARQTIVTIRRDNRGSDAAYRFGRSEERLRRLHVALLALTDVGKGTNVRRVTFYAPHSHRPPPEPDNSPVGFLPPSQPWRDG
jgi:hypothetical protein